MLWGPNKQGPQQLPNTPRVDTQADPDRLDPNERYARLTKTSLFCLLAPRGSGHGACPSSYTPVSTHQQHHLRYHSDSAYHSICAHLPMKCSHRSFGGIPGGRKGRKGSSPLSAPLCRAFALNILYLLWNLFRNRHVYSAAGRGSSRSRAHHPTRGEEGNTSRKPTPHSPQSTSSAAGHPGGGRPILGARASANAPPLLLSLLKRLATLSFLGPGSVAAGLGDGRIGGGGGSAGGGMLLSRSNSAPAGEGA